MKHIYLFIAAVTLVFLLTSCNNNTDNRNNTNRPPPKQNHPANTIVNLKATDKGNVSDISFKVILPPNTKTSLLDYNGKATIQGRIQSNTLPCLNNVSFNCEAQLSVGNINASGCSIDNHRMEQFLIVLFRGQGAAANPPDYSILSIQIQGDMSCYLPSN